MTRAATAPGPRARGSLRHRGLRRHHLVCTPPGRPTRLILDLHGSGFDAETHLRVTGSARACADGALVLAPQAATPLRYPGRAELGWAWHLPGVPMIAEPAAGAPPDPDDLGFLRRLVTAELDRWGLDRVHVLGFSGGARLASYLPRDLGVPVAALVAVAGLRFPAGLERTSASVLAVHGTADRVNPYTGGAGPRWEEPVEHAVRSWAQAGHGRSALGVRLVTLDGAPHCWPGSHDREHQRELGRCPGFDATGEALRFFDETDRASAPAAVPPPVRPVPRRRTER